jgi:hypothetical protein
LNTAVNLRFNLFHRFPLSLNRSQVTTTLRLLKTAEHYTCFLTVCRRSDKNPDFWTLERHSHRRVLDHHRPKTGFFRQPPSIPKKSTNPYQPGKKSPHFHFSKLTNINPTNTIQPALFIDTRVNLPTQKGVRL